MQQWFNFEGERHLLEAESVEESGDRMEQILNSFTGFLIQANVSLRVCVFFFFPYLLPPLCVFVSVWLCLHTPPSRTEGTTPWRWCQRQSDSSRVVAVTRRGRHSGVLSAPSRRAWRTSCAGQRHAAGSCRSWSMCVTFVSRSVSQQRAIFMFLLI